MTRSWTAEHPAISAPPKRSRAGWIAAGLGLVAAIGAGVWLRRPAPAIEPAPLAVRIEAPTPVVHPPPAVEEVDAGPSPEPVEPVPPRKLARPAVHDSAPTVVGLTKRIKGLEARLRKSTKKGAEPDPSAIQLLNKHRLRLSLVLSGAERKELSKKLDSWEKTFVP